jgi:transcriptional regulator with XRE-family HTH domain
LRQISGRDLKLSRVAAGLKQRDVATAFGARRERISHLERETAPSADACMRFLRAVAAAADERDAEP